MDRATDLYNMLVEKGEVAIDDLIETRATEELFVDFKRSSDDGRARHLSPIDRKNLAKAISGFGNSAGGVIVWGVDCSPDREGADVARAKVPITNLQRFLGNLQGAVSGCTMPPHSGIQHHAIRSGDLDTGFVATYIPASETAPHQVVGQLQYYIRAGSDFVPAPHQVLAGMFGRRPQPRVFPMFTISRASHHGTRLICEFGITITNGGPGIARDLFFTALIHDCINDDAAISWQFLDNENWTGNFVFGRQISIVSRVDFRLPPKGFVVPLGLKIECQPPFSEDFKIVGNVGCDGSPTFEVIIGNSAGRIQDLYDDYFHQVELGAPRENYAHRIAAGVFGPPEDNARTGA